MKANDVMIRQVICVKHDTTVEVIARLLVDNRISGVPVVDEQQHVLGMVCESDLFLKEKGIPFSAVKLPQLFAEWVDPNELAEIYARSRSHTAADIMTRDVTCVQAEDGIGTVAWVMAQCSVKRVPVLDNGVLVGIITRADIIRVLAQVEGDVLSCHEA